MFALAHDDGTTALHWAARADSLDTVELLLEAGADARAADHLRRHTRCTWLPRTAAPR